MVNRRDVFVLGAAALAQAQSPAWRPRLFDAHQNETVIALTEHIIPATDTPGAKAALVNRHIDLLLADGDRAARTQFLEGLGWLDSVALREYSKPFVRCDRVQQLNILNVMDEAPESDPGGRFFRLAKRMTADVYYATEIGFRELNKGGRAPVHYGCRHAGHGG
jgi:hypothetical protein